MGTLLLQGVPRAAKLGVGADIHLVGQHVPSGLDKLDVGPRLKGQRAVRPGLQTAGGGGPVEQSAVFGPVGVEVVLLGILGGQHHQHRILSVSVHS